MSDTAATEAIVEKQIGCHVNAIMQKMNAGRQTEAAFRARL